MLETIIAKLCFHLGNAYGYDYQDLVNECDFTPYEIERIKEILENKDEL